MTDKRLGVRFSVTADTSPELFRELQRLSRSARAERLRTLALVGLAALSGGVAAGRPAHSIPPSDETNNDDYQKKRNRDKLANTLAANLLD